MVSLDTAQRALAAGSWARAAGAFRAVVDRTDDPAAHEGLAQAAWWLDDADTCLAARETAYRACRDGGDLVGAARAATALAWDCVLFGRGESLGRGWLGRARELLAGVEEQPEHGWLLVREAELALAVHHDPVRAIDSAQRAAEVGQRTGDGDLSIVASAIHGLALTTSGAVEQGLARLDSAVLAATAGDVADLMWMGKVLCWLIAACHETQDVTRAEEWCRRAQVICLERDLVPLYNVCRIQYASVKVSGGSWVEAEQELTEAVARLAVSERASRLEAVVQLGELRRRQGRAKEAEALFRQAEFHPVALLGRILIRFAAGQEAEAWAAVQRLLGSLPSANRLARAEVLLPAIRIAHALGEDAAAASAADELRDTATAVGTDALLAMSALADAHLADPQDESGLLHEAVRHYHEAGLRHDEAEARLLLARSLVAQGDATAAQDQVAAATDVMRAMTDSAGLVHARQVAQAAGGRGMRALTSREAEVLRLVARGMSNIQIAEALTLSEHTVHRHVSNILTKLEQPTRAAAVSHALTAGIL